MVQFIVGSHGKLASGIKSSLGILIGDLPQVNWVDAYIAESTIEEDVEKILQSIAEDDQLIMLSDLYGGSVNTEFSKYLKRPNTVLITGFNLALVIELVSQSIDEINLPIHTIQEAIENCRRFMQIFSVEEKAEEEFFEVNYGSTDAH